MKKTLSVIAIAVALFATACKKNVEPPVEQPIDVKVSWTVSNAGAPKYWRADIAIDKALEEEVIITASFKDFPAGNAVEIPITVKKGSVTAAANSTTQPSSLSALPQNVGFTIKGTKQYKLTF